MADKKAPKKKKQVKKTQRAKKKAPAAKRPAASPPPMPDSGESLATMPAPPEPATAKSHGLEPKPAAGDRYAPIAPKPRADSIREELPSEPAQFPEGLLASIDYLLHHPLHVVVSIREDANLLPLCRLLLIISAAMSGVYGAVMGATNLLQGSAMPLLPKLLLTLITAAKTPILFMLTMAIVFPPIYVSNAFVGARNSYRQVLALLLASLAITTTTLASMTTVAFFFALTSRSYDFIKLLHVAFFAYAGFAGLSFFLMCVRDLFGVRWRSKQILIVWLLLYIFVGTQLAWVLRPFVGSPGEQFQVFREREGNFYEAVLQSVGRLADEE